MALGVLKLRLKVEDWSHFTSLEYGNLLQARLHENEIDALSLTRGLKARILRLLKFRTKRI